MCWFLYIVECSDNSFYTGISKDPEKRVHEHNYTSRGAKYTRSRRPVILRASVLVGTKSEALKKEIAFKKLSKKQKQQLIECFCFSNLKFTCDCQNFLGIK